MKKYHLLVLGLVLPALSLSSFAQSEEAQLETIFNNFENCLKSDNCGVVTSTLINVMRLYYQYPEKKYDKIIKQLETLIAEGATDQIRFMATLVKDYLNKEKDFDWMMDFSNEAIYYYFSVLTVSNLRGIAYGF
jgi:hypothetical protein